MRRRVAVLVVALVCAGGLTASCGGSKKASTTTSPVPDVTLYSKLDDSARSKRVQECKDLTTVYGGVLNALTTQSAAELEKAAADIDALRPKFPERLRDDVDVVRDTAKAVRDAPANMTKLTSKPFLDASGHVQGYLQKMCDFKS